MNTIITIVFLAFVLIPFILPKIVIFLTEREKQNYQIHHLRIIIVILCIIFSGIGEIAIILFALNCFIKFSTIGFIIGWGGVASWLIFIHMAIYWTINRKVNKYIPIFGLIIPILSLSPMILFGVFALPVIILNFYLVWYHTKHNKKIKNELVI